MKLNTKMYLGLAVPAVMLVGISGFSLYSFWRIDSKIGTIYDDRIVPMQELKFISDDYAVFVIDAVNKAHAGMWTMDQAYSSVNSASERIKGNWQKYKLTEITEEEKKLVQQIEVLFVPADRKITELKTLLQNSKNRKDLDKFDGPLYLDIDTLTHKIQELIDLQLRVAKQEREEAAILYNNIRLVFMGLAILAVIVASPIGFFLSKYVIATLKQTIDVVAFASTEIAVATEEQERIAAQQAVACSQVNTSMTEINNLSSKSAQQANAVAKAAEQALVRTQKSTQVMDKTLERVSELQKKVQELGDRTARLNEQTNQIENISRLVSDLANQTNMLALNAAVEAVRAGQGGKGFAVVAGEIRKLADQSKQSAQHINTLVVDLQTAINATVGVTQRSIDTASQGVKTVGEMAAEFQELTEAVRYSATITQDISLMVKEQLGSIQQVVEAMQSINAGAQESASGISQTKIATHNLHETANFLRSIV